VDEGPSVSPIVVRRDIGEKNGLGCFRERPIIYTCIDIQIIRIASMGAARQFLMLKIKVQQLRPDVVGWSPLPQTASECQSGNGNFHKRGEATIPLDQVDAAAIQAPSLSPGVSRARVG
jgi:hypothetical protein